MSDIHQWVTTANGFDGFKITRGLGIVRGITCRSRSVFGQMGAGLQQMFGGNITLYTELAEHARVEAYELMIQHAVQMGANAVVAMRYDATELVPGVTEVLAYGTAVVIERITP
ncbi:MAG TPA: YbjQ family protein [Fimbriimonas sp.]|nr:YbjQ family protein [Fimbriimonas sp.]